jgi:nicotinamide phosphoribosyltransferase
MLTQYPTGLVACVSDSFDINHACSELWGNQLKEEVLSRDGVLIVRPDSGKIVPMVLNVLRRLGDAFGITVNDKNYMVLNNKVRVIQGDGCSPETIRQIIDAMIERRWSIDNIAFGMGGGLLQRVDRDTQRFAFKCSSVTVNGEERDVYKTPVSDPTKNSKRGRLALVQGENGLETILERDLDGRANELHTVFSYGMTLPVDTFDNIRRRAAEPLA